MGAVESREARLRSLTASISANAPAAAEALSALSFAVSWHRWKALLERCEHRRRGLDVVECCASDYAAWARIATAVEAASCRGSCAAGVSVEMHPTGQTQSATMCLLGAATV